MKSSVGKRLKNLGGSSWFITLFATTLGVFLALYLDNLNSTLKTKERKEVSLQNIYDELVNNELELSDSMGNVKVKNFLDAIIEIDPNISGSTTSKSAHINVLKKRYPELLGVRDSTHVKEDQYLYKLDYQMEFELHAIKNIAWETSKMSNITNEFDYDCLQELVEVYSLQELYLEEQQKVLGYVINQDLIKINRVLYLLQQLRAQLLESIREAKEAVQDCSA